MLGSFPVVTRRDGTVLVVRVSAVLPIAAYSSQRASDERAKERGGLKIYEELIIVHVLVSVGKDEGEEGGGENRFEMGKEYIFHI